MLDEAIQRYGRRLYGLCRSLCHNPADAEDLYQDTWLRVLRSLDHYQPERDFMPWLTQICVNTYRSTLRRLSRLPLLDFSSAEEQDRTLAAIPAPEPPDYGPLYDAVSRLPDKLRITVILFYFQDLDLNATSQALQIPLGTVKSRLNKARKLLKEVLTDGSALPF